MMKVIRHRTPSGDPRGSILRRDFGAEPMGPMDRTDVDRGVDPMMDRGTMEAAMDHMDRTYPGEDLTAMADPWDGAAGAGTTGLKKKKPNQKACFLISLSRPMFLVFSSQARISHDSGEATPPISQLRGFTVSGCVGLPAEQQRGSQYFKTSQKHRS